MTASRIPGIVTKKHGQYVTVLAENTYFDCRLRGKVTYGADNATPVVVGDDVEITLTGDETGIVEIVHDRRTVLSRPAVGRETFQHVTAANMDSLIVVTSVAEPPLKPGLIDRFLIAGRVGNLNPAIVINKSDLGLDDTVSSVIDAYEKLDYDLFVTSARAETAAVRNDLEAFHEYLISHRSILAGHSGVGKSSLLNRLYPDLNLRVSHISEATGKGRHTTSHVELFHLPDGGYVIDSPGIKVLGFWQLDRNMLDSYYPEMVARQDYCRFTGCHHTHEPDCAVKEAVASGDISEIRYNNYLQILHSLDTD